MKRVPFSGFRGMNNISSGIIENGVIPSKIINAVPDDEGVLQIIPQYEIKHSITGGCHDLWDSPGTGKIFCTSGDILNLVDLASGALTPLLAIPESMEKVYYVNVGEVDYCGNEYWLTAVENGVARIWGESVEDLHNMRWRTPENSSNRYLVGDDGTLTSIAHPGEDIHKPIPMGLIDAGHGRIWGALNDMLVYSESQAVEWFDNSRNNFPFSSPLTMIACVPGGIFIGTEKTTMFLPGTNPEEMGLIMIDSIGVVKHSMLRSSKKEGLPENTPVWMNANGEVLAGFKDGSIAEITKGKLAVNPVSQYCRSGTMKLGDVETLLYKIEDL